MAPPKMTLKKLFHDTFSPLMLKHGFKRYKDGYVRVHGDGMLQAITLASFSPDFVIRFACHPYWIFGLRGGLPNDLGETDWMEEWHIYHYNGEPIPMCLYFKDKFEQAIEGMELWLKITKEIIIPFLDQINNMDDYMEYMLSRSNTLNAPRCTPYINQYILLYKSYLEGSFDNAEKYIKQRRQWLVDDSNFWDIDARIKDIDGRILPSVFGVLMQKIEENDLEWIVKFREQKCEEMRKNIHDILKIDFPE